MIPFISAHLFQFWLAMTLLFLVMELFTGGFFIICFSLGALSSLIAVFLGASFYGQLAVFAIFSILSLLVLRPLAVKYFYNKSDQKVSNADAIIGRIGEVSETIEPNGFGRVKLDGDDWKAQSSGKNRIEIGSRVRIVSRESIIVPVEAE